MRRIRFAPDTADDLEEIHRHIERESGEEQATKAVRRILDRAEQLARFPRLGMLREHVEGAWRMFPEGAYLIYYREIDDGVELLRVLHSRRDQTQALGLEETDD